jgi:hypothetical protein
MEKMYCPHKDTCPSRPEESPNCIPKYFNCLVYKLIEEEISEYESGSNGLDRFLKRKEHAKQKGWDWDVRQLGIGSKV